MFTETDFSFVEYYDSVEETLVYLLDVDVFIDWNETILNAFYKMIPECEKLFNDELDEYYECSLK